MTDHESQVRDQAIGWVIRLRDPLFDDWDAFTAWLEADSRHNDAYESAALIDEDCAEMLSAPKPKPLMPLASPPRRQATRRLVLGSVLGVSLVAFFGLSTLQSNEHVIETAPGERRTLTLASGDRIDMNGGTRLVLDGDNTRFASLDQGEALFTVRHDEARPFVVEAGGAVLRDVGTVFNVTHGDGALELAVAEGAVIYNPGREAVTVPAGRILSAPKNGKPSVRLVEAGDVAGWREGRLAYSGAPLSTVAADLSRNLGVQVEAAGNAQRPFSGVIVLAGKDEAFFQTLGPLLGVEVRRSGDGWVLVAG